MPNLRTRGEQMRDLWVALTTTEKDECVHLRWGIGEDTMGDAEIPREMLGKALTEPCTIKIKLCDLLEPQDFLPADATRH